MKKPKKAKEIKNPFTDVKSFVWSQDKGLIFLPTTVREIRKKPDFSFEFDALFCEATIIKKVVNSFDQDLTQSEINEVLAFLSDEEEKPELVNGVNEHGKYVEGVTRDEVVRLVSYVPDAINSWRFDLNKPGENWIQAIRIDKDGNNLGFGEELPEHTVITESEPLSNWNEVWKYDLKKKQWYDARPQEEIISSIQEGLLYNAYLHMNMVLENSYVEYGGFKYGTDFSTRSGIIENASIEFVGMREWVPKSKLEAVELDYIDFKDIAELILQKKSELFNVYMKHKINIKNTTDVEKLKKYDVTTGYKDDTDKT